MIASKMKGGLSEMKMPPWESPAPGGDSADAGAETDDEEAAAEDGGAGKLADIDTDDLVAELEARGFTCSPPAAGGDKAAGEDETDDL